MKLKLVVYSKSEPKQYAIFKGKTLVAYGFTKCKLMLDGILTDAFPLGTYDVEYSVINVKEKFKGGTK